MESGEEFKRFLFGVKRAFVPLLAVSAESELWSERCAVAVVIVAKYLKIEVSTDPGPVRLKELCETGANLVLDRVLAELYRVFPPGWFACGLAVAIPVTCIGTDYPMDRRLEASDPVSMDRPQHDGRPAAPGG